MGVNKIIIIFLKPNKQTKRKSPKKPPKGKAI